jgi:hypothetical protein
MSDRVPRPRSIYDRYDAEKSAEWKNPPNGFGSKGQCGQQEGDICTINGAPSHLRRCGGEFDNNNDAETKTADAKEAAYKEYDSRISQAWRHPQ